MNKLPLQGFRSSTAYLGLARSSALDPDTAAAQRIAGVQWYWTPAGWVRREDTLPRARLVAEQQVSTDPAADLAGIDPAALRWSTLHCSRCQVAQEPHRSIAMTLEASCIRTDAPGRQLLIVAERFHEGWRGNCDGAAIEIVPVYGDYMGVVVPAGCTSSHWRSHRRVSARV